MLRSLKAMHGYAVLAKDGDIGKVHDFFFHDDTWIIRYLVVDTGHWLPGRKVLVATNSLGKPNCGGFTFPVALTRLQVEKSPDIDTDQPVSRQQEAELHSHFGWPLYWTEPTSGVWPPFVSPAPILMPAPPSGPAPKEHGDPHLRSQRELAGYHIHASDGVLACIFHKTSKFSRPTRVWG